jgi:maltose alpha-D-glucosyltransferase/alpha-amylase
MGDAPELPERNSVRTTMQWNNGTNGGFSAGKAKWPSISKGPYSYKYINVAAQAHDRQSLLNTISRMISLRKSYSAFGWGNYEIIECDNPGVLIHVCRRDSNVAIAIHNFTEETVDVTVSLSEEDRAQFTEILADHSYPQLNGKVRINGFGYRWFYKWPLG